jgi:hydrophobic/amphiphilic exporter-1 (mainly G- bacteria), HAE1 family
MNLVQSAVRQPVTVAVGVLLVLLTGVVAFQRIAIQLTPNVEDTIIAVTTRWEGASPLEVEREVVDKQEEKLQGIANLKAMTSKSQQGNGQIRLEFAVGMPKEEALRQVSDKLREVSDYPENVDEPVIEASDPDNRDYIAWVLLRSEDTQRDVRDLQDFAADRLKPRLERIPGMSEVNVLGGRERETQVIFDPELLAAKGLTPADMVRALRAENRDVSAGALEQSKSNVRVRLAGLYETPADVERTVIAQTAGGPVYVGDVAEVKETYKEARTFVRSMGQRVLAINFQKEVGTNVIEVMDALKAEIVALNQPDGLLAVHAAKIGLEGRLYLDQAFDQTVYIDDALALVTDNIYLGGGLAILVLLLFLRSIRSVGIIALAIPISVIGAIVVMVSLGRSINVISLAGMAFAIGMVVDNAIVVLENIYRHLEMGKKPVRASIDGGREVLGAVVAATLTTAVVFVPVLLIEEEAGQLFRDIALAIVAAVVLSLVVSITVIPATAARLLKAKKQLPEGQKAKKRGWWSPSRIPDGIAGTVHFLGGSVVARIVLIIGMTAGSIYGTLALVPPTDYLPTGNRNLVFGLLIPPPGYNLTQQQILAERIEKTMRPHWVAGREELGSPEQKKILEDAVTIPVMNFATGQVERTVKGPPLDNYFLVSFDGIMFHGAISQDAEKVVDILPLFGEATRAEVTPDVFAFAFQVPLFRLGGNSGSAIKIDFTGDDLDEVGRGALAVFMQLMQKYGPGKAQPDPSNFNVPTPELRFVPDRTRLAESGLTFDDVAQSILALGDGAIIGEYRMEGDTVDLKLISRTSLAANGLDRIAETPLATPLGTQVPLGSVAPEQMVNAPQQINRVGRQRSITIQFTPPAGVPLGEAIDDIARTLEGARASGAIPAGVDTAFAGSASKLDSVSKALLGDGTFAGIMGSSLVLALLVVYLLMCVLFQSFGLPLVIMFSVPLATLGGFAALAGVHFWSLKDPYLPVQNLDILTMLGFVILIGVVVNNAILIVHQTLNFMRPAGEGEEGDEAELHSLPPRKAITEAVRSRVRPIFMGTLTSVGGMAPLVLMPGSGSELYRGLGGVVVGGLMVSTIFTLVLVPMLLGLYLEASAWFAKRRGTELDYSTPALGAATGVLLAALATFGLGGCSSTQERSANDGRFDAVAERIVRDTVAAVPTGTTLTTTFSEDQIEELLGNRLDELESLGGESTWRTLEPDRTADLSGAEPRVTAIGLGPAIDLALEHNLGLRGVRLRPDAAAEGVLAESGAFDSVFFADAEYERVDQPRPVPTIGGTPLGSPKSTSNRLRVQSGLRQLLSTGATVSATAFAERFDNQSPGIAFTPDPAWRAGVALELTQPLLAGYGDDATNLARRLAERQVARTNEEIGADVLAVRALVTQAYWNLAEAEARRLIQQRLVARGEEVVRVLDARREFDTNAAQFADAVATVEQRRADLVRARLLVEQASDSLIALLDDPDGTLAADGRLTAEQPFALEPVTIDLAGSIDAALTRRPELQIALLDVGDAQLRARVAENLSQARLDLVARVEALGEDDTFGNGVDSMVGDGFIGGLLGLSYEVPLGNRAGRADERRARIESRIALLAYEELVRDIVLEVKQSLRDLRTSYELIGATRSLRIAQTENLRALLAEEEQRSRLTPEFLALKFGRQESLARAQLDEVQAIANYNRALAAFERAVARGE